MKNEEKIIYFYGGGIGLEEKNRNDILSRLKFLRGKRSQADFAEILGMNRGTYASLEQKGITISFDLLEKISKIEKVNLHWLITGKGEPYLLPDSLRLSTADKLPLLEIQEDSPQYKSLSLSHQRRDPSRPISPISPIHPIHPIPIVGHVSAGEPVIIYADSDQSETIDAADVIDESFYYRLKYNHSDPVCFVEVSGDSMEPEFHDHDLLLIERNIPPNLIKRNAYGIFSNAQGEWTFKRFNPQDQVILLEPLNSQFNTIAVMPADLRVFGIAIALFRSLHI